MPIVLKSGSVKLLEPSGSVHASNGTALPFTKYTWPSLSRYCLFCDITTIPDIDATESGLLLRVYFHATSYFSGKELPTAHLVMFSYIFCQFRPSVTLYVAVGQNVASKSAGHYTQLINQINGFADLSLIV